MSGEYDPIQTGPDPDIVSVRKTFEIAGLILGRRIDDPELDDPELLGMTIDPDTGELPAEPTLEEEPPASATESPNKRGPALPFVAQRPIIFSGTSNGFFESVVTDVALTRVRKAAVGSASMPHATITDGLLIGKIMKSRHGQSPSEVAKEVRKAVDVRADGRTIDRVYGHIASARALSRHVVVNLNDATAEPLMKDVENVCRYFDIPFVPDEYIPHITVAKMATEERAVRMAKRLDKLVHKYKSKEPRAIGLGGILVLNTR